MFPLSKRAIDVIIEPLDPAVQQAVSRIKMRDPSLLTRIEKIVVHPSGGAGELGHVESGPRKNPKEIHLFKNLIEQIIHQQFNLSKIKPTSNDYIDALERAIVEVIGHESGHIGPERPIAPGAVPFLGEPEAEAKAKETVRRIYPEALTHAALELDGIRCKFMPDCPMGEPDLSFVAKVASGNRVAVLRDGLKILRRGSVPAVLAVEDARKYNRTVVRQKDVAKRLGSLTSMLGALPNSNEFTVALATWQEKNDLEPTGKLDRLTLAHMRARMVSTDDFPRNFGIVTDGIYRGRQPDNADQLNALRDKFGVRRVITLNDDMPPIADWCRQLGLQHVDAMLSSGAPHEPGWEILGSNLSPFLLKMPTFIHCRHGADRTGGVVARFRTETGWPCDLAYAEAKAFGFKDRFPDMIDRFTEACRHDPHEHRHPPIDTAVMRHIMEVELAATAPQPPIEQDLIEPTPSDIHYTPGDSQEYDSGSDTILSPFSIRSIPVSPGGGR